MKKIKDLIKVGEYTREKPIQKFSANISTAHYANKFIEFATNKIVYSKNPYIVDSDNKEIINQLYKYLTCASDFEGDLSKGILLIGPIGTGKTIIMESFCEIFNTCSNKIITMVGAKNIVEFKAIHGFDYLHKRPVFIDDIGKEQTTVNTYGTVSKPMEDLINERYKNESLTFGTSNLKIEDMPYNPHTLDRIKQMFNVIILHGKSRRL